MSTRNDLNPKAHPIGSVVYFVHNERSRPFVKYGTVIEHYADTICIQLYEPRDTRLINGVPIKEFFTPSRWQKLPKNWFYGMKLFETTYSDYPKNLSDYNIKSPESILQAIKDGVLVKVQDNDHAGLSTQIDSKNGWRIIREYNPYTDYKPDYTTIHFWKVYGSYDEADAVVKANLAELERQSNMSDYDWAVEQIDKELKRCVNIPEDTLGEYRDWLLKLDRVEDVEIRYFSGRVQWKYINNQRWLNIEL